MKFSETGVKQIMRDLLIPWWNAYSFFVTYANVDNFHEDKVVFPQSTNVLDRWIVSSMETLITDVTAAMDEYDLQKAIRPFVRFVEDLTNWYIRRSRRRFWKSTDDADKANAYRTLRYVLVQLSKVAAPFTPFIADEIYCNLKGVNDPESVHLCDFPQPNENARDRDLENRMAEVQTVVELGRRLRADHDLKVRQPLQAIQIAGAAAADLHFLIEDELNVKNVIFTEDERELCCVSYKANFKTLGRKCGPKMKEVAAAIAQTKGDLPTEIAGIALTDEDVIITRIAKPGLVVASEGAIIVALETTLTKELVTEGLAREFVSHVQAARKAADFDVSQRICLRVKADQELSDALTDYLDYIKNETLTVDFAFADAVNAEAVDINGHTTQFILSPATAK